MRERPTGVTESELIRALRDWEVGPVSLDYAPVGFGDYHWSATGEDGRRWFLTLADLPHKPYCGEGADGAFDGLRRALDTSAALYAAGLDSVVAPLPARDGATVRRVGERYALSVLPWTDAPSGEFGQELTAPERARIMRMLAALHRAAPPAAARVLPPDLPARARLESALAGTDGPWGPGPYGGPARELLRTRAAGLRRRLAEFDRRARRLRDRGPELVVTHGEPHPGNVLWRSGGEPLLVDWDTAGLAVPERDLWHAAGPGGTDEAALETWAQASGRTPDRSALELYRLRWDLDDVCAFLDMFRAPHGRSSDTDDAWRWMEDTVTRLVDGSR
ncbi:phosphotransferase [Streptomyces uncialis]|uniref:phosphotransferase n=1 Tax=Streptomyces uncialis TaxID=1048205 RepID=UPI0038674DAC|nr:phosphotransferase [Streptomyces uncialis]